MKTNFMYLLILLFIVSMGCDDSSSNDDDQNQQQNPKELLIETLAELGEEYDIPGYGIAVANGDSLALLSSFGYADKASKTSYSTSTFQPIGSISKTFIAASIVKAIEMGYFTLETPVNQILGVKINHPYFDSDQITVKHLVTHTSSLIDSDVYMALYHILPGEDMNTEGAQFLVNAFDTEQRDTYPLEYLMGNYYLLDGDLYSTDNFLEVSSVEDAPFEYSNIASSLAAFLIEVSAEMSYEEFVATYVFNPLSMQQSGYHAADLDQTKEATLYFDNTLALPRYYNESYPDGSVHTTIHDMGNYMLDMMSGLRGDGGQLFTQDSYDLLFNPILSNVDLGDSDGISIFWFTKGDRIMHNGSDPGTTTDMSIAKDGSNGYVILTNSDASTMDSATNFLAFSEKVGEAVDAYLNTIQ